MQEQEHDIGAESPLSLELRQHGTTQTIAVVGLELGPFSLSCELEPLIQDLDDQDLAVVLRGSSTRLRSLDLTVRYDALKDFVVSQLVSHRSITRVRVIAEGNGLGIMGVWSDSDCRAPFGLRLDLVAGFDSEIDLIVSRVALFGKSSISPIDLALLGGRSHNGETAVYPRMHSKGMNGKSHLAQALTSIQKKSGFLRTIRTHFTHSIKRSGTEILSLRFLDAMMNPFSTITQTVSLMGIPQGGLLSALFRWQLRTEPFRRRFSTTLSAG